VNPINIKETEILSEPELLESDHSEKSEYPDDLSDDYSDFTNNILISETQMEAVKKENGFKDESFAHTFNTRSQVDKGLTDVEEATDEGEWSGYTPLWPETALKSITETKICEPNGWIWDKIYKYNNPCADEISNIIKNTRETFVDKVDETTPLLSDSRNNNSIGSGYSDSVSHFSNFPKVGIERKKMKFTDKPGFTDSSNSFSLGTKDRQEPDFNLFRKFEEARRTEQRLINKVCQDSELSDLVLNLYKYKQFYRNSQKEKFEQKEDQVYRNSSRPLYPRHSQIVPKDEDFLAPLRKVERERDEFKLKNVELTKRFCVLQTLQQQMIVNCKKMEQEKLDLSKELTMLQKSIGKSTDVVSVKSESKPLEKENQNESKKIEDLPKSSITSATEECQSKKKKKKRRKNKKNKKEMIDSSSLADELIINEADDSKYFPQSKQNQNNWPPHLGSNEESKVNSQTHPHTKKMWRKEQDSPAAKITQDAAAPTHPQEIASTLLPDPAQSAQSHQTTSPIPLRPLKAEEGRTNKIIQNLEALYVKFSDEECLDL